VRESLFARLSPLVRTCVLDLYAGSGALGIEALSRGAAEATFVERSPLAARCIQSNLVSLGLQEQAHVLRDEVSRAVARLGRLGKRFDVILADPPYGSGASRRVGEAVARAAILQTGGMLVIESDRRHAPGRIVGLLEVDVRRAGDTLVTRYTAELERTREEPS